MSRGPQIEGLFRGGGQFTLTLTCTESKVECVTEPTQVLQQLSSPALVTAAHSYTSSWWRSAAAGCHLSPCPLLSSSSRRPELDLWVDVAWEWRGNAPAPCAPSVLTVCLCVPAACWQMRRTRSWPWRRWRSWTGVWTSWRPSRPTALSATWPPTR